MLLLLLLYIASKYIRKWLELPVSATLSNVFIPPQSKFGLKIILPSAKFIQHQTVSRSALKYSPNVYIHNLRTVTSSRAPTRTYSMTFTKTKKTYLLRRLEKKMKKDFKTTSYRKVLSFSVSLIIPHSTLCGYPFRVNFLKNIFNFTIRYRDRGACLKRGGGGGG
jgi:hypothetical protein